LLTNSRSLRSKMHATLAQALDQAEHGKQTIANRYAYDLKVDIGTNGHLQATFYPSSSPLWAPC
jgi:hypothetical protein